MATLTGFSRCFMRESVATGLEDATSKDGKIAAIIAKGARLQGKASPHLPHVRL